ncbi:sensor histidine kinase [Novosphingobium terrae]|uniref:sensor histidine kinase n=1 Tax=Novosphingobium terrae TaxID=2726189 RepID=UPI001F1429A8|nr:HAMP domain-containing sensor histidine kinase [Novosphingobium terrae]
MRPALLSLHARVAMAAVLSGVVVLVAAVWVFQFWLSHVVSENLNARMDTQVALLRHAIAADGQLDVVRVTHILADLEEQDRHWGWQVTTPAGTWRGGQAFDRLVMFPGLNQFKRGIYSAHAFAPDGAPQHVRLWRAGRGEVLVSAPDTELSGPETAAVHMIVGSLAGLCLLMALVAIWQLHFGLRPVRQISRAIAEVRAGRAATLPLALPRELTPLAEEINSLVEQNRKGLLQARHHVANLAHGLKTPLATLALRLEREKASEGARQLVAQIDRRIVHHLRRARSAAIATGGRASADLAESAQDLVFAMRHLNSARRLEIGCSVPEGSMLAMDREDLDEILGNLLDNACRHARGRVMLAAQPEGQQVIVTVEDDGPGIAQDQVPLALSAGRRLDESGEGYGFGLAIVQELVGLYGGTLALGRATVLGGLRVEMSLPGVAPEV